MTPGNGIFVFVMILGVAAEVFDHSGYPMLSFVANLWEIVVIFAGAWKIVEVINNVYKK